MSVAPADMTIGPDMAMRMPNGVNCGNTTCAVGKDCCVMFANNMESGATCVDSSSQCTSGNVLTCDGPEDCPMTGQTCCGTINIDLNPDAGGAVTGGSAMCGTCTANFNPSGSIGTRLCHTPADCTNFSLSVAGFTVAFDKCCTQGSGGVNFCAPDPSVLGATGQTVSYTCQ